MLYRDKRVCPFCRKKIDAQATVCPYCQKESKPEQVVSRAKVAIVGMLVLFIVAGFFGSTSNKGTADNPSHRRVGCARAVKAQLKAPTTAKFDWDLVRENFDTTEPFAYVTTGRVSSENSFGAMLTKDFSCYHDGQNSSPVKAVIDE